MQRTLVSIIIPAYNRAHIIASTLDSVLEQSYPHWECLIVDDGSSDGTEEVVRRYCQKDQRFKFYNRPKSHLPGANGARNYGALKSEGEYLVFLDSDDLLHRDYLSIKIELLEQHELDVVISRHTTLLEDIGNGTGEVTLLKKYSYDIDFILSRNITITSDCLMRKELVLTTLFDETLRRFQDHEFYIRFFRQTMNIAIIEKKLYYHRMDGETISSAVIKGEDIMLANQIRIHKEMKNYYMNTPEVIEEYNRKARKMYLSLMKRRKISKVLKYFDFFRKAFGHPGITFGFYFSLNMTFNRGYHIIQKKRQYNSY